MRPLFLCALFAASLFLAACGGGGGDATPSAQAKATVDGGVTEVDGATSGLGGVELVLVESGERVVTAGDGSFGFEQAPVGSFRIALVSTPTALRTRALEGDDDSVDDDSVDDGDESSESEIELYRVVDGESIRIRIRIRDGLLEQVDVSRSENDEREVELCLEPTAANDDPDMEGCLEVEQREDRTRFELEVEDAEPGRELELVIVSPDGVEETQGTRIVDLEGDAEWEFTTLALPFDATTIEELEGYDVVVRDAGTSVDLLVGTVPELPAAAPSEDDDAEGEDDEELEERGKARLTAYEDGLEGYVEIESEPLDNEQEFEIEAENLAPGREVEFFIEDAAAPGTFISLGTRFADSEGEAELELDNDEGATLPGGATTVADLVGLGVEVRDAVSGALLLDGTVPALMPE